MEMNSKGQAAVTDAMFFLLIIVSLSVFLFGFSNTYGSSIKQQINDHFTTTFGTNALKTILYSSTPRNPDKSLSDPNAEIDYLLAILKEDYADDQEIDDREKLVLANTISSILAPISDSTDYVFYITIPDKKKFVYFFFHTTNFEKSEVSGPGRFWIYKYNEAAPHIDYFCAIKNSGDSDTVVYDNVFPRLSRLLANVGPTSQASSAIKLVEEKANSGFDDFRAQVDLILWDAVWLGTTEERVSGLLYDSNPSNVSPDWGCKTKEEIAAAVSAGP